MSPSKPLNAAEVIIPGQRSRKQGTGGTSYTLVNGEYKATLQEDGENLILAVSFRRIVPEPGGSLGWHRYAYGSNNPPRYIDLTV